MFFRFLLFISFIFFNSVTHGKKFSSQFCEFQLPSDWNCSLEGTEWFCQSTNKNRQKEAIIILAAKERGQSDSMAFYQDYLKKPKKFKIPGGQFQVSEPKYTKTIKINDHLWVDSLHLASEVPGFYTRYLATIKIDLVLQLHFQLQKITGILTEEFLIMLFKQ